MPDFSPSQDFSEDTYRTLAAADNAVMLVDAAKGLEPQTRKLFEVRNMARQRIVTCYVNSEDLKPFSSAPLDDATQRSKFGSVFCQVRAFRTLSAACGFQGMNRLPCAFRVVLLIGLQAEGTPHLHVRQQDGPALAWSIRATGPN